MNWTGQHERFKSLFPHASKSTIARNCGSPQPVGGLDGPEPKQDQRSKIKDNGLERSEKSVAIVATIVSFRRRRIDGHDNLASAHKPLVDRITDKLEFASDDDPRLRWEYAQVVTKGKTGTQLLITATTL